MSILQDLNQNQQKAVTSITGETLVIAGAGSGKTAVLTRRCAHLILCGARPGSILSLTFTNKAAAEMNKRIHKILAENGINLPRVAPWQVDYQNTPLFCTFHSLGVRLLKEFGDRLWLKPTFNIIDEDERSKLVKEILKELNQDSKIITPKMCLYFISLCKQELLTSEKSKSISKRFEDIYHQIYRKYEDRLKASGVVDFDDLILLPYIILSENKDVKEICNQRWLHVQVDEFQDTNEAQFKLLKLLY